MAVWLNGLITTTTGQIIQNTGNQRRPTSAGIDTLNTNRGQNLPDSTIYRVFQKYSIQDSKPFEDSLLTNYHKYDPVRHGRIFGIHLGNLGSSSRPLFYDPVPEFGIKYGFDQFKKYQLTRQQFQYFGLNRPFTGLFFTPGGGQQNFMVKSRFSRNFSGDTNFTLDYQRIVQDGFYSSQKTKSTYLGLGFWKKGISHDLFVEGILNANNEQHNGGISDLSLFNESFYNFRQRIPTNLKDANTRMANVDISVTNYFHLSDSLNQRKFSIMHEINLNQGSYKFYDEDLSSSEQLFYNVFLTDDRGIRTQFKFTEISNSAFIILSKKKLKGRVGMIYQHFSLSREIEKFSRNNIFVQANADVRIAQQINFWTEGKFSIGSALGDFDIKSGINQNMNAGIGLSLSLNLFNSSPSLLEEKAIVSQVPVWENNFEKTQGVRISSVLEIPKLKSNLEFLLSTVRKPIYRDSQAIPRQYDGSLRTLQLHLNNHMKIWKFHLSNSIVFQSFSTDLYHLPEFFSEHEIYLEGKIFKKKMLTRLGLNTRFIYRYHPPAYSPVFGTFIQQSEYTQPSTALTDLFSSFKIDSFRGFIRLENINHLINKEVFLWVKDYPQFDYKIRLGVSWLLED